MNLETQFTPGPWKHERRASGAGFDILTADFDEEAGQGFVVARCSDHLPEADAKLIAAGPDLIGYFRAIADILDQPVQHNQTPAIAAVPILRADARAARHLALCAIKRATE